MPKDLDEAVAIIQRLTLELATELDLHYDDEDLHALKDSIGVVKEGAAFLEKGGHEVHADVLEIVARFNRANQ